MRYAEGLRQSESEAAADRMKTGPDYLDRSRMAALLGWSTQGSRMP